MVLNPNAKFLAVAGDYQVAVVVLPRASSTRIASTLVDCKYVSSMLHRLPMGDIQRVTEPCTSVQSITIQRRRRRR